MLVVLLDKDRVEFQWLSNHHHQTGRSRCVSPTAESKFTLEQATKSQRGSRGIAVLFSIGARGGWVVDVMPRSLYSRD
jgi:hypothetical protein